jgi:hypothetical protein
MLAAPKLFATNETLYRRLETPPEAVKRTVLAAV